MNDAQNKMLKEGKVATYSSHKKDSPEGSIFLAKEGACTITITGAAAMSQEELDGYGEIFVNALNEQKKNG